MAEIEVFLIQDKDIIYKIRQGVRAVITLEWLEPDDTPSDLTGKTFIGQIRKLPASNPNSTSLFEFPLFTGAEDDYHTVDLLTAKVNFVLSEASARTLTAGEKYYFEGKMLDGGEAVESIVIELDVSLEYAKP